MRDIGVVEDEKGRPFLELTGGAEAYRRVGAARDALGLTFPPDEPYAQTLSS